MFVVIIRVIFLTNKKNLLLLFKEEELQEVVTYTYIKNKKKLNINIKLSTEFLC